MNTLKPNITIIIVCGLPGTGKSTLAEAIADKLKLPIFSVDPIESAIIKSGIGKSFETGLAAYLVAETLADEHLKLNQAFIIDAVCGAEQAKQMWRELAKKRGAQLTIVECFYSDPTLHKNRLEARVRGMHGLPEVDWAEVESCRKEYTSWHLSKLPVDSVDGIEANLNKAISYLTK